eukprot:4867117-Prymnesium_polylepis.1
MTFPRIALSASINRGKDSDSSSDSARQHASEWSVRRRDPESLTQQEVRRGLLGTPATLIQQAHREDHVHAHDGE